MTDENTPAPADAGDRNGKDSAGTAGAAQDLTLNDVAQGVIELGKTVTDLAAKVDDLHTRTTAGPWWNLDALHPGDADRLHGTVIAFGDHLKAVYAITALPHRWDNDPALLAEFTALYVAWVGAYREPRAGTTQPLQWHEALSRTIDRIHNYQDRRRQRDSVDGNALSAAPPLPVAFIPEPAPIQ